MLITLTFQLLFILFFEVLVLRSFYKRIKHEEPDRYFTLAEMNGGRSPFGFYLRYASFRIFPIVILCLLNYKILASYGSLGLAEVLGFNIALVFTELLMTNLRGYKKYRGLGLSHQHLIFACIFALSPLFAALLYLNFANFLPTTQGVIDNVWAGIIIYIIFSFFGFISKNPDERDREDFSPFTKEVLEAKVEKYNSFIYSESQRYSADSALVRAVAIYEMIQRPSVLRLLERIFVFTTRFPATQGVMQYKASKVISDEESISLAIRDYFRDTKFQKMQQFWTFREVVSKYNFSSSYINDVYSIYSTLTKPPQDLFTGGLVLIEPQPFQEVGARVLFSGWVPKSWIESNGKLDHRVFFDLLDLDGSGFMGSSLTVETWPVEGDYFPIWSIVELQSVSIGFLEASEGRITVHLTGQNSSEHYLFLPLVVKQFEPVGGSSAETIDKHEHVGETVKKYEEDIKAYYKEAQELRDSFPHNKENDESENNHTNNAELLHSLFKILEESETTYDESPYIKERRLREELDEKYKDAIKWRGPLAGATPLRINGFLFTIHSNDHGKHLHVIHKGKGIDARFSFPEIELIDYKKSKTLLSSKQEKALKDFLRKEENFKKLEEEFLRRENGQ